MIEQLIRDNVRQLTPYKIQPKMGLEDLILDGNENTFPLPLEVLGEMVERFLQISFNRYPDSSCGKLCSKIAKYLDADLSAKQILPANGSDEILQYLIQTFINPGETVMALSPTFSMYKIFTQLAGGTYVTVPLEETGDLELVKLWEGIQQLQPKMLILCSPNNPTGTRLSLDVLEGIVQKFAGIVVIDEAYGEFCEGSMVPFVHKYPHLAVTRTFSKALGLAGIRLGYLVAQSGFMEQVRKVVAPYHLNSITQMIGEVILDHTDLISERVRVLVNEREKIKKLLDVHQGWRVYPSEANFLFVRGKDVNDLAQRLSKAKIVIRQFSSPLEDAIRITIGRPEENKAVIGVIQTFIEERGQRDGTTG